MKHQTTEKQKINKPSELLSQEENEHFFSLLGRPCKSMCTAVAQVYTTEPPAHSIWIKRNTGVVAFIRDSSKRSYFIRVYCLLRNELVFEEEMYESIYLNKSKEYLVDFEGRDCLVAINFASEFEANNFYKIATTTISNRNKRRATNKRRSRRTPPPTPNIVGQNVENDPSSLSSVGNHKGMAPMHLTQIPQQSMAMPSMSQFGDLSQTNNHQPRDRKRVNKKFTKADISMPTDFKHITHVGWTAQKGFDLNGEEVDNLNSFLERAGVSEKQLNDRDTRAFIYDFIQSNNVLDSVKLEQGQEQIVSSNTTQKRSQTLQPHTPPPVPTRHHNGSQRIAPPPPPPPTRQPPPPVPKTTPPRAAPPGRPPPISIPSNVTAPAPPPPPPPPAPPMAPPPPSIDINDTKISPVSNTSVASSMDSRSALMDSIRKGAVLKKVDPATLSTGSGSSAGDSRTDLLSEIRQGVELRPAVTREPGAQRDTNGTDALADALRRALIKRGNVLRSSDEDSDESDDGEWDD